MLSGGLMLGLIVFYLVVVVVSAWEGNWPRALYWTGASLITTAVLWMK